ncbi:FAD dependent oxidoreductase [Burkholderia cepacia]|nr:pyridine nucleotide-disulfide oxidoreductase family protein [Burkholderia cepacia ATCC 25416]ALK20420.1 hypothetical protein APZ15_21460 [Burkholderia cepacia ATCC 25416]SPU98924.1 FAD dependent oxidoreductase [Burkholderia cepacia]
MHDHHEVIVIGGSFAGLSAAMQLARARRRVLVIDAGRPRNRFAAHAHGFFGQDGNRSRPSTACTVLVWTRCTESRTPSLYRRNATVL